MAAETCTTLTRAHAAAWVDAYGEAWRTQDPAQILALFTEDGVYVERPYDAANGVYRGHAGIRDYWTTHVRARERNISFRHIAADLVFDTEAGAAVAKWEARFEVSQGDGKPWKGVQFLQMARLSFAADGRVRHFEEFWHAKAFQRAAKGLRSRPGARGGPKRKPPELGGRTCAHAVLWEAQMGPFGQDMTSKARRPQRSAAAEERKALDASVAAERPAASAAVRKLLARGVAKSSDLVAWYRWSMSLASLVAEDSDVTGAPILQPSGTLLWDHLRRWLDAELEVLGVLPFVLPTLAHTKVSAAADAQYTPPTLSVRASTEPVLYDVMAKSWIKSRRSLPMLLSRWGAALTLDNVKMPLPFLRAREVYLQEGHAAHAEEPEAAAFADKIRDLYVRLCEELLAVSPKVSASRCSSGSGCREASPDDFDLKVRIGVPIPGAAAKRPGSDALDVVEVAFVKRLAASTAAAFKLRYEHADAHGASAHGDCLLSCFSVTMRAIGAALCAHGDDLGFVLPPRLAPVQVVLIPFAKDKGRRGRHGEGLLRWLASVASLLRAQALPAAAAEAGTPMAWAAGPLRVEVDAREDVAPDKKVLQWLSRGAPLLLCAEGLRPEEGPAADGPPSARVWLAARDAARAGGSVEVLSPGRAAQAARRALELLHGRLLAAHRAAAA